MQAKEKLTAIADAIRAKTGGTDALTLDGMAAAIPTVYAAGEAAANAACAAEHYTTVVCADVEGVTVELPFAPDVVYVMCFDPRFVSKAGTIGWIYEPWGFGQYIAFRVRTAGIAVLSTATIKNFLTVSGNRYTFKADTTYPWRTEFAYTVMACRFPDRDDAARIRAFFESIISETSVTLQKEKVDAAFTEEEWEELLAAYPSITVALI